MTTPHELESIARQLVAPGKGILAADESSGTIKKRFDAIALVSTEESRRAYRDLLFSTPGVEAFLSGVILYDETLRQRSSDGQPFAALLTAKGILPGIKVDAGAKALAGAPGETITEGLDGLRERCAEYRKLGARFTKWRAVIEVDTATGIPSDLAIDANAHALARYAAIAIEQDLVPIVEPEVLMDGDHSLETCRAVTERTLRAVFAELARHRVALEAILLKPNMVVPGKQHARQASPREVADATLQCFRRTVPAAVPGIVFLSGGQSEAEATANLDAMNRLGAASGRGDYHALGSGVLGAEDGAASGRGDYHALGSDAFGAEDGAASGRGDYHALGSDAFGAEDGAASGRGDYHAVRPGVLGAEDGALDGALDGGLPWQLSFSYGRALQASAIAAWQGKAANVAGAQRAFHHRARLASAARDGRYEAKMEKIAV